MRRKEREEKGEGREAKRGVGGVVKRVAREQGEERRKKGIRRRKRNERREKR